MRIWTASGRPRYTLNAAEDEMKSLEAIAFSPDSKQVATAGAQGTVRLWDVAKGSIVSVLHSPGENESLEGIVFSPDGHLIATGSYQGIRIWSVAAGQLLMTLREGTEKYTSIVFSPDGSKLVGSCEDGTLRVWGISQQAS